MPLSNDPKTLSQAPHPLTPARTNTIPAISSQGTASAAQREKLCLLINSRSPIIAVETSEEQRCLELIGAVAQELSVPLYIWSVTEGLGKAGGAALYNSDQPEQALANIATIQGDAIFLMKDFARYCDNDRISRRLRDLADGFRTGRRCIVLLAASIQLPSEVAADSVPYELGLPSAEELLPGVRFVLAEVTRDHALPVALDLAGIGQLAKNLVGLPEEEALRVLRKCVMERNKVDAGLLDDVLEAKRGDAGGPALWPGAAKGRAHHGSAGLREKLGGARRGGRMGLRTGAAGCRSAVRQVCGREREAAEEGAGPGAETFSGGAVD